MSELTFREYMAKRPVTSTPNGDFTEDWRRNNAKDDPKTLDELHRLMGPRACVEAILAARSVWRQYLSARKRHGA
jgi:hypothetical protein